MNLSSRLAPVLALALLAAAACSRRKLPSEDFARASEIHSQLYGQELDDAYIDPRMDEAVQLLQRVPANSLDADSARQLLDRIQKNRERVTAERAQRAKDAAAAAAPPPDIAGKWPPPQAAAAPDAGAPDAGGPAVPTVGMTVDELSQRFSRCFEPGDRLLVQGQGFKDTWQLKDIEVCRELFPGFSQVLLLIDNGKIWNYGQKASVQVGPDAGTASTP